MRGASIGLLSVPATPRIDVERTQIVDTNASSISAVMQPAGRDVVKGVLSAAYLKDPSDPQWKDDAGMQRYRSFMAKYMPESDPNNVTAFYGYTTGQLMMKVLDLAADNLTRENIMKQAASLNNVSLDMLLPGASINTSTTYYRVNKQFQMMRFDGRKWERFGAMLTDE